MAALITLEKICLAYGLDPLLDHVNFQIDAGERVCLIGRNGAGKSSFLKIIDNVISADSGKVVRAPTVSIARLTQELPEDRDLTIYEVVAGGLAEVGVLLKEYHHLIQHLSDDPADLIKLEELQHKIDAADGWQYEQYITQILQRLDLPADKLVSELSGGWQRRVALAKALVCKPDLLLLDEPTNHLDIEAIGWLEEQLLNYKGGILFITHDRSLLKRLATRIVELDRGNLYSWPGDYDNFLRRKEEALAAEDTLNKEFDKKLALEEQWIRQGVKARRTRNEGRVRALESMRRERNQRRVIEGKATFEVNEAKRSGQCVIDVKNISHAFGEGKTLLSDFSIRLMRGDRIGLIGPNGVGKSTLLNIILGNLKANSGEIEHGTQLQIAYFDQLRERLDPTKSIIDNVSDGRTTILVNGKEKHIVSYLSDFLFSPARLHTPIRALSGGECNRILLARLFTLPANVIVMDEPTNDLDVETLELLEELLSQYTGTLILVSHDRTFLDNIVTSTIVFEGDGIVSEFIGGYSDWRAYQDSVNAAKKPISVAINVNNNVKTKVKKTAKLSYKDQQELLNAPKLIETLEAEAAALTESINEPSFYQQATEDRNKTLERAKQLEILLTETYQRWAELEALEKG